MKFIRQLISRKSNSSDFDKGRKNGLVGAAEPKLTDKPSTISVGSQRPVADALKTSDTPPVQEERSSDLLNKLSTEIEQKTAAKASPPKAAAPSARPAAKPAKPAAKSAPMNIWDLEGDDLDAGEAKAEQPVVSVPKPVAGRSQRRPGRTKTRLIGFEKSEGTVVDLFDPTATVVTSGRSQFPVGWIVVTDGPGRGEAFALKAGMSQIGRGEDQTVQLDFGDMAISRTNHAAIAYDPETHKFLLGHGGKSNIVRLNDSPVISTEELKNGDMIRIGETTLRFARLCDETFNWSDKPNSKESDDVAIA
ncbi:FHA domain-containing protein [Aestuariibius sp. 2305UL40-4]|uniref:FHA domain-containing protein n=1 Tax=Aestuariibius violaceus TaxID=3234132 RepID=UPI00345E4675